MLGMKTADQGYEEEVYDRPIKKPNTLSLWGNEKTMNLNTLVLTNIQSSQYFRVNLYELKTYHEVVDEIYYQVTHLEPWEKGSRKTSGQTGMCGGVRGVGAGGIVSTAFCILYKLFTLKLTRKQVQGLMNHRDSPYIRGLGFMYVRYTQPPADLWDWFEPYFDDEEEIDARAGGGQPTTIGVYVRQMLTKLDWFSTLFPRIPVPIQKEIDRKLGEREREHQQEQYSSNQRNYNEDNDRGRRTDDRNGDYQRDRTDRNDRQRQRSSSLDRDRGRDKYRENDRQSDRDRGRDKHMDRDRHADKGNDRHGRRERDERKEKDRPKHRDRSRERERDRYYDHHHSSSSGGHRDRMGGDRYSYELEREKERIRREKKRSRSTSRSKDRHRKHRTH